MQIQCLACGRPWDVPNDSDLSDAQFVTANIFKCSECGARTAYGQLMPRIVEEPFVDDRGHQFLRIRFQDPTTKADVYVVDLDPQYAASHAKNTLSLVLP
jgi:hypothetical protein